jgi:hypothetical protein
MAFVIFLTYFAEVFAADRFRLTTAEWGTHLQSLERMAAHVAARDPTALSEKSRRRLDHMRAAVCAQSDVAETDARLRRERAERKAAALAVKPLPPPQDDEGPGNLSPLGPRHQEDHADFSLVPVAPTAAEMLAERAPYLPRNVPGARHHLPESELCRLLDVHFRLLRHDAIAPLLAAVTAIRTADDVQRQAADNGRLSIGDDRDKHELRVYRDVR